MSDEEAEWIAREFYRDLCRWIRDNVPQPPTWDELTREERSALAHVLITRVLPPMATLIGRFTQAREQEREERDV